MPAALGLITGKFRSNFRCFLFFALAMDRLRRCSATSQACKNGKSFKRDHRTQIAWRVTNVLAHGPGIKLMNGLAEASTNGNTIYAYRCRGEVLKYLSVWTGPRQTQVPSCYGAGHSWNY